MISKNTLERKGSFERFNKQFRLSSDEIYLKIVNCKTWEGNNFKFGQIFISKHFICFHTTKGKELSVIISSFLLII